MIFIHIRFHKNLNESQLLFILGILSSFLLVLEKLDIRVDLDFFKKDKQLCQFNLNNGFLLWLVQGKPEILLMARSLSKTF